MQRGSTTGSRGSASSGSANNTASGGAGGGGTGGGAWRRASSRKPLQSTPVVVAPVPKRGPSLSIGRVPLRVDTPPSGVRGGQKQQQPAPAASPSSVTADPAPSISKTSSFVMGRSLNSVSSVKSRLEEAIQSSAASPGTPPMEQLSENLSEDDSSSISEDMTPSRGRLQPKSLLNAKSPKHQSPSGKGQRRHPHELDAAVHIEAIVGSGGCSPKKRLSRQQLVDSINHSANINASTDEGDSSFNRVDASDQLDGGRGRGASLISLEQDVGVVSRSVSVKAAESPERNSPLPPQLHASPPQAPPPTRAPPRSTSSHQGSPSSSFNLEHPSGLNRTLSSVATFALREGKCIKASERDAVRSIVDMCRQLPLFGCFQLSAVCTAATSGDSPTDRSYSFVWSPRNDVFARGIQYVEIMGYRTLAFDSVVRNLADQLVGLDDALMRSVKTQMSDPTGANGSANSSNTATGTMDEGLASRAGLAESCMATRAAAVFQLFAPDAAVPSLFHSLEELEATSGIQPGGGASPSPGDHMPFTLTPHGSVTVQGCSSRSSLSQSILSPITSSRSPPMSPKDVPAHYASTLPPPFHSHDLKPFLAAEEGTKWQGEQEYVLAALLLSVAKGVGASGVGVGLEDTVSSYLMESVGLGSNGYDPSSMTTVVNALNTAITHGTLFGTGATDTGASSSNKGGPAMQLAEQLILSHPIVHVAMHVLKSFDHWGDSQAFSDTWCTQVRLIFCSSCLRHNHVMRFRGDGGVLAAGAQPIQGASVLPPSALPTPPGGSPTNKQQPGGYVVPDRSPYELLRNPVSLASLDAAFATLVPAADAVSLFLAAHVPNATKVTAATNGLVNIDTTLNPLRLQLLNALRRLQLAASGPTRRTTLGSGPVLLTDFDCGATSQVVTKVADGGGSYCIWLEGDRGGDEKKVWFRYAMMSSAGYISEIPSSSQPQQGGSSSSSPPQPLPPPFFATSYALLTSMQCSIVPIRSGVAAASMPDISWGQRIPFKIKNIAPHTRLYKSGMRPSYKVGWTCNVFNGPGSVGVDISNGMVPPSSSSTEGDAPPVAQEPAPDMDFKGCEKAGGEYRGSHSTHRWALTESAQYVQKEGELKEGELTFSVCLPPAPSWTSLLHVNSMGDATNRCDRCTHCRTPFASVPPVKKGQPTAHGCPYCRLLRLLVSQQTLQHTITATTTAASNNGVLISTAPLLRPTMHVAFCDPYSYGDLLSHITLWHAMVKRATSGIRFEERVLCRSVDGRKLHLLIITSLEDRSSKQLLQENLEAGRKPSGPIGTGGISTGTPMTPVAAASVAGQGFYNSVQSAPFVSFIGGKRVILVSGRVHPSEVTASHAVHGIIQFLLSADPRASLLRDNFVFFVVPMINPDGVSRGHSRLDQHGFNLNRCYNEPSSETQPTVLALKNVYEHLRQHYHDQFTAYFDFHSHASQLYGFAFGNCLTGVNQPWNMFLTKLIETQSSGLFDFGTCKFGKNQMSQKDGTSRVLFGGSGGLVHSYTVELSHYAHLVIKAVAEGASSKGTSGSTDTHNLSHSNGMAIAMPLAPKDGSFLGAQQSGPHVIAPYVGRWIPPTNAADHFLSNCCASHEDWYSAIREERHWMRLLSKKQISLASQTPTAPHRKRSGAAAPSSKNTTKDLTGAHLEAAAVADEALAKPTFTSGVPIPQYTVLRQSAEVGRACILSLLDYCALDSSCLSMVAPTSLVSTPGPGPSQAVVRAGGLDKLLREVKRESRPAVTGTKSIPSSSSAGGSKPSWNTFNRQT